MVTGVPYSVAAHLPAETSGNGPPRLAVGAVCEPWPGFVQITDTATQSTVAQLTQPAVIGELIEGLPPLGTELWDRKSSLDVRLFDGHVASLDRTSVLAGGNRAAIEHDDGSWEIVGFSEAALTGEATYRLTGLLRGLDGTWNGGGFASTGRRLLLLDKRVSYVELPQDALEADGMLTAYAGSSDATGASFPVVTGTGPILPLAPVHLRAAREPASGDILLNWTRRARRDGNSWTGLDVPLDLAPELYRVTVFDGMVPVRVFEPAANSVTYTAADQAADFGGAPESFNFTVCQMSPVHGPGHQSQGVFNG